MRAEKAGQLRCLAWRCGRMGAGSERLEDFPRASKPLAVGTAVQVLKAKTSSPAAAAPPTHPCCLAAYSLSAATLSRRSTVHSDSCASVAHW